eukprot:2206270-Amphidinium_carterae.1
MRPIVVAPLLDLRFQAQGMCHQKSYHHLEVGVSALLCEVFFSHDSNNTKARSMSCGAVFALAPWNPLLNDPQSEDFGSKCGRANASLC